MHNRVCYCQFFAICNTTTFANTGAARISIDVIIFMKGIAFIVMVVMAVCECVIAKFT